MHVPFCQRLCPYCHFYRIPEVTPWKAYLEAVQTEIAALDQDGLAPVHTIYVGGGTPTLYPPEFYSELFGSIQARFDLSSLAECTIEMDGNTTPEQLAGYVRRVLTG